MCIYEEPKYLVRYRNLTLSHFRLLLEGPMDQPSRYVLSLLGQTLGLIQLPMTAYGYLGGAYAI